MARMDTRLPLEVLFCLSYVCRHACWGQVLCQPETVLLGEDPAISLGHNTGYTYFQISVKFFKVRNISYFLNGVGHSGGQ